jgi:hypothetical protein
MLASRSRPPYRGGAWRSLIVQRVQRVLGKILGTDDRPFVYGELTVTNMNGRSFGSPVGNDGSFYFENLHCGVLRGGRGESHRPLHVHD